MRKSEFNMESFKQRRQELAARMNDNSGLILAAHPEYIRNSDVHHPYRPDSNMIYMTGFDEPESVFIFRPGKSPESVLFVREKDEERETWDGFRYGVDGTKDEFQVDETYDIKDFDRVAPPLLTNLRGVYYDLMGNHWFDRTFKSVFLAVNESRGRTNLGKLEVYDSRPIIGEMRIIKSPEEQDWMRRACEISSEAHIELMKATKPGMTERALHGLFIYNVMARGADREGYGTIVAGGDAATTLHYVFNDQPLNEGELVLIDGGGEYKYMSSDITRTYPVNGKFNLAQKRIYEALLGLQKDTIEMIKPGMDRRRLQEFSVDRLVDLMIDEKLLSGSKQDIIETQSYRKYYPHGIGHWLGMDVHDAGKTEKDGEPRPFEEGLMLTVEPGIYIPQKTEGVPEELKGLGIRIEDDILVTATGYENMTSLVPKEVEEIENLVGVNYR